MSEKEKEEFARLCDIAEALIETLEDIRKRQKIPKAGVQNHTKICGETKALYYRKAL